MEKIFLWGTGEIATDTLEQLGQDILKNYEVLGFIDNDPNKQGKNFYGFRIFSP